MDFNDYLRHDATSLASLVARGDVSPGELLDLALARVRNSHGRYSVGLRVQVLR